MRILTAPASQFAVVQWDACPTDPALPVGYEDQLFATLRSPSNVTIPTTITWVIGNTPRSRASTPAGVMHALDRRHCHPACDGCRWHDGYLLTADARGSGERRDLSGQHRVW